MENSARIAGYSISVIVLATLMGIVANLEDGSLFRRTLIQVEFPTVGALLEDDPITLKGVEVGRVDRIERGPRGPLVTLELFKRVTLPRDTRFINYNYSLFGARMVVLVPGKSPERMDMNALQQGHFTTGVAETIHKVDELLRIMTQYKGLADRLDRGNDTAQSFRQMLTTRVYPALEEFTVFAEKLEMLERRTSNDLDGLARTSTQIRVWSAAMAVGSDSLVTKAQLTVDRLARLTAQTVVLLNGLEKMILASQDTSGMPGKLLAQRDLYERTLTLSHALHDLLRTVKEQGLKDIIHMWRNIHIRKKPASKDLQK